MKTKMKWLLLAAGVGIAHGSWAQQKKNNDFHQWASTPPMGWNSWDCFGPTVVESEVKANADYMAKHLKAAGWNYIVVDIRWYVSNDKAHGYNETNPDYILDSFGRFQPAVNRFPSAAGGKGFKPLADYLHAKGLKFGIHIMRGVPVEAVKRNLPIKGTKYTAKDIYSTADQCRWLHDMYTVLPDKPGAQEYYNSLFELYASWGLDFIKIDDLSSPIYFSGEIDMIRKAINRTGRKIVLSTSPGETPIDHAAHVQKNANMWRTVGDFWDSWPQLKEHFSVFERWNPWRAFGAYPDGDMLPMGRIGIRAERGNPRMTAFTRDEQYTLMTLWSIFKSPLMFGGNLPDNDKFTDSMLTNKEVLYVLNKSTGNKPLFTTPTQAAWVAEDPANGDKFLALFNLEDQEQIMESKAVWKSAVINRQHPSQPVEVDVTGAKKLYLAVADVENIEWDHADWINPLVHKGSDTVSLTSLPWVKASAGWSKPRVNKAVAGGPLVVEGTTYANGIGTHSASLIEYDLPAGATKFTALAGLDKAGADQNVGGTTQFMIFTQQPSGPMPADEAEVSVDLQQLGAGAYTVKDLWTGKQVGRFNGKLSVSVPRHGAKLFRLTAVK